MMRQRDPEEIANYLKRQGAQNDACIVVLGKTPGSYRFAWRLREYLEMGLGPIDYIEATNGQHVHLSQVKGRVLVLVGDETSRKKYTSDLKEFEQKKIIRGLIWAMEPEEGTHLASEDDAWIKNFGKYTGDRLLRRVGNSAVLVASIKSGGVPFGMSLNEYLRDLEKNISYVELEDPKSHSVESQLHPDQTRNRIIVGVDDAVYTSKTIRSFGMQIEKLKGKLEIPDWLFVVNYDRRGFADIARRIKSGISRVPREEWFLSSNES